MGEWCLGDSNSSQPSGSVGNASPPAARPASSSCLKSTCLTSALYRRLKSDLSRASSGKDVPKRQGKHGLQNINARDLFNFRKEEIDLFSEMLVDLHRFHLANEGAS